MENSGDVSSNRKFTSGVHIPPQNPQIGYQHERPPARFSNAGLESVRYVVVPEGSGQWRAGGSGMQPYYPLRNSTKDCLFFVHTGFCSFGNNCRFNHPAPAKAQEGRNGKSSESEGKSEKSTSVETCKFYLAGICKNGALCRFDHTIPEPQPEPQKFNLIGLPFRLGEPVCAYYMRTGTCGYVTACKFHHPDPIFYNPDQAYDHPVEGGEDMEYQDGSSSATDEGLMVEFQESTHDQQPCYSSASLLENGFQVLQHEMKPPSRAPAVIIRNPVDRLQEPQTVPLNDVGLPRRPGKKECWHYEGSGHCKFGLACVFDHPPKPSSVAGEEEASPKSVPDAETAETKE